MLKVKDIRKFREHLIDFKYLPGREADFIGYSHPKESDGEDVQHRGFFNVYHQESKIDNKLSTVLGMAQDSQAVFEFVQNAVDCNSTAFYMYYRDGYLLAINNGESFKFENIHAILGLAQSTKSINEENIGKFGVGFKLIHRLVGESNGLDELTKDYCGPILFSWHNRTQLDEILHFNPEHQLQFDNEGEFWHSENSPWFFKILLTCMPVLPYPHDSLKDLDYNIRDTESDSLFNRSELNNFLSFLKEIWQTNEADFSNQVLNHGSIFFLKLGKDKEKKLDEDFKYFQEGIQYALAFIEQMSTKKGLKHIYFNDQKPIEKDDIFLEIEPAITLKVGSDEHNEIKLKLSETEKPHDIQFIFAYQKFEPDNQEVFQNLKKSPNFYKYFPMGKEIWGFNFILHSNVFSIESSRREFIKDPLNELLFKHFSKKFCERIKLYIENDFEKYCQIFLSLFTSDNPNTKNEGRWLSDNVYEPLINFIKENTPVLGAGVYKMDKVVVKATNLDIALSDFGIDKKWFLWLPDEKNKLIIDEASDWKIKQWDIINLINEIDEKYFPETFAKANTQQKLVFLEELEENWDSAVSVKSFWQKISRIEEVIDLVLQSDSKLLKQKYLEAFTEFRIDISELSSADNFLCKKLQLADQVIETPNDLTNFQNQVIIVEEEKEYILKNINTNNVISFNINDKIYEVKLSDILPSEYGNTGLVERIITKLKEFKIDGQKLLGISSSKRKDVIYNQIKTVNKTHQLTPWQFVYCANYSLEKNSDFLAAININRDVNISDLLQLYFSTNQPFPIAFSKYIAGYESGKKVYPSEYAHNNEWLDNRIIEWFEAEDKIHFAQRLEFFEKIGLITRKDKNLQFRIALLNNDIENINADIIKESKDLYFLQHTVYLFRDKAIEFNQELYDVIHKLFQHMFYYSDKASSYMPYVQIKNVDEQETITYDLLGSRNAYNTLISADDIQNLAEKGVSLRNVFQVVKETNYQLIDSRFCPSNIELTGLKFVISQYVDDEKLKYEAVRYDYPEWESHTGHHIRIIKNDVPQCYKFKNKIVKEFREGKYNFDKDSNTIYVQISHEVKDETLFNAIITQLEQNLEPKQVYLLDHFKQLNPYENTEAKKSRKNVIKEQLLKQEDEIYDYEWFYKMFLWEYEAQNESIKGNRLKFSEIVLQDDNTLMLTDYEFETIPENVEFISEKIGIKIYGNHQTHLIYATIKGFNEFEVFFDIEDIDKSLVTRLNPFTSLKAVVILPPENLLFDSLKTELFDRKLLPENTNLREYIPRKYNPENIEFIFGPPGTGKTTTLALRSLITLSDCLDKKSDCKIIILTPTNRAADVIIERMYELVYMDDTKALSYLEALSPEEKELFWPIKNARVKFNNWIRRYGRTLSTKLINYDLFTTSLRIHSELKVVATTVHRLSYDIELRNWIGKTISFTEYADAPVNSYSLVRKLVLDEASMISLPHSIYAILHFGNEEKNTINGLPSPITIGGDPFQLLPVGKTPNYIEEGVEGLSGWATESIYSLVKLNNFGIERTPVGGFIINRLMTQYRSNPVIGKFFSAYKYNNQLQHFRDGSSFLKFTEYCLTDLTVFNYEVKDENVDESPFHKIYVFGEYSVYIIYPTIISIYYAKLIVKAFPEKTVSIICPYGTQTRLVREIVNKEPEFKDVDINVSTVHGYQGNESDIVLFLLVPPKLDPYTYSHFNNQNLINVGISRAKENLIVLAPRPDIMRGAYEFNSFLEQFGQNNESTIKVYDFYDTNDTLQKMTAINHFNDFNVIDVEDAMNEGTKYVFYCGNGRVNVLVNLPNVDEIKEQIKKEFTPQKPVTTEAVKSKRKELAVGDTITGEVIGIHKNQMTAFIKTSTHHKCVVHRNNVSKEFVKDINEILKVGQKIDGKIKNIDPKRGIEISLI